MSNAIGQSATAIAITPCGEEDYDFVAAVARAMSRKVKDNGVTRERQMLVRQQLIDTVKSEFRQHFAGVYGKSENLPSAVYGKIVEAVDSKVQEQLNRVNVTNVVSLRRGFHWSEKTMSVTDRITVVGENILDLKEQHLGINCFISAAERRLKDLEAKKTPDLELEKQVKDRIRRLMVTRSFIEAEIKHQESVK